MMSTRKVERDTWYGSKLEEFILKGILYEDMMQCECTSSLKKGIINRIFSSLIKNSKINFSKDTQRDIGYFFLFSEF